MKRLLMVIFILILLSASVEAAQNWQTFETGTGWVDNNNDNQTDFDVGDWSFRAGTETPVGYWTRSTDYAHSGTHSYKVIHPGSTASSPKALFTGTSGLDPCYMSCWIKIGSGYLAGTGISGALKTVITRTGSIDSPGADNELYTYRHSSAPAGNIWFYQDADQAPDSNLYLFTEQTAEKNLYTDFSDGNWHRLKLKIEHVSGTNYHLTVWADGVQATHSCTAHTGSSGTWQTAPMDITMDANPSYIMYLMNYSSGGQPAVTLYLDDLYYGDEDPDAEATPPNPPTSATVDATGETLEVVFPEAVTVADSTGFSANFSTQGSTTVTYTSGSGTTTLTFDLNKTVQAEETGTLAYTTTTNGIEDGAGNDLESFSDFTITNESTMPTDTTDPTVTISTVNHITSSSSTTINWTDSDSVGVTARKWRVGSAPDADNGTTTDEATSTAITGLSAGANTVYIGAADEAGNWGSSSVVITYTASPLYVTQNGAGNFSGSSYANAMSVASHNTAELSGDDIIYLCDTITSTVIAPSSGTSGHPIVYRGDYEGHPCIIDGEDTLDYCVRLSSRSYITFYGITTTRARQEGFSTYRGGNLIYENCTAHNMNYASNYPAGWRIGGSTNVSLINPTGYDIRWNGFQYTTQFATGDIDGLSISGGLFYECDHDCIDIKAYDAGAITNVSITKTAMRDSAVGLYCEQTDTKTISNVTMTGNVMANMTGSAVGGQTTTGYTDTPFAGWQINNNTIYNTGISGSYAIEFPDGITLGEIKGNIIATNPQGKIMYTAGSTVTEDYNIMYGANTHTVWNGAEEVALGAHSEASDPLLDSNYMATSGSPCNSGGYDAEYYYRGASPYIIPMFQ